MADIWGERYFFIAFQHLARRQKFASLERIDVEGGLLIEAADYEMARSTNRLDGDPKPLTDKQVEHG